MRQELRLEIQIAYPKGLFRQAKANNIKEQAKNIKE